MYWTSSPSQLWFVYCLAVAPFVLQFASKSVTRGQPPSYSRCVVACVIIYVACAIALRVAVAMFPPGPYLISFGGLPQGLVLAFLATTVVISRIIKTGLVRAGIISAYSLFLFVAPYVVLWAVMVHSR